MRGTFREASETVQLAGRDLKARLGRPSSENDAAWDCGLNAVLAPLGWTYAEFEDELHRRMDVDPTTKGRRKVAWRRRYWGVGL